jgi:UDP-N-acetylmuramate-alanine ligase
LRFGLPGKHNLMNALMAIAMAVNSVLQPMPLQSLSFIQRDKKTVFLSDKNG